jgi:holo-[acyl-carrier protein] synthase
VSGVSGEAGAPGGLPFKVGIDLLEIERLERALERTPRLAERLFTPAEREYAASRGRPGQHLAARFCAKEAVAKALGVESWNFHEVEVVGTGGPPRIRLSGSAAARAAELGVQKKGGNRAKY